MSLEQDWEKRLLERPLPERGLPVHVVEGIQKRLREKPKSKWRTLTPVASGVVAAALVAVVGMHDAGHLWGGKGQQQNLVGNTTPIGQKTSSATAKTLNLGTPGPIEHYVWKHQGQTDEVWQKVQEGYWRVVKTFVDGSSIKDIYKNGYLYEMHYGAQGDLLDADKIKQQAGYDGKASAFAGMEQSAQGLKRLGSTTYNGIKVNVYQVEAPPHNPPAHVTSKLYVDTVYQLPLKQEEVVNGSFEVTDTWSYGYLQQDGQLFEVPQGIVFQEQDLSGASVKG